MCTVILFHHVMSVLVIWADNLIFTLQITDDFEKEMREQITKRYGEKDDDTSEAFTEGLNYLQEEVCVTIPP